MAQPPGTALPRLHGLDAMRAAMMLLGLVLHSAVSYTATPLGAAWPYQDAQTGALFDWIVFIIHLFRMPAFFVIAGFFAAFLYDRERAGGFLAHRVRRLLLPLAGGWLLTVPVIGAGFAFAVSRRDGVTLGAAAAQVQQVTGTAFSLGHLWFIYDLFLFCLAAVVIVPLLRRLPDRLRSSVVSAFGSLAPTAVGCLLAGVVTTVSLLPMTHAALDTSFTLLPPLRILAAYGVFFTFGWLLFVRRDLVPTFGRHPWRYLAAGLAVSMVYLTVVTTPVFGPTFASHAAAALPGGIATWLLIYGLTGLFVRYFNEHRPAQRYLSDAAYWMYIVHLPFTIWMPGVLAPLAWPAVAKFAIVLAATTGATVVTYHYLVRATIVGVFLNGRRFDRRLPATPAVS